MAKRFKWTLEIEVDESWVADGFNLTDERANDMLRGTLRYADGSELHAKVLKSPDPDAILKVQGYEPGSMTKKAKKEALGD